MEKDLGKQIVVLDGGFVYVGDCEIVGDMLQVSRCKNLRRWGTTKGLGELCAGPLKNTQADDCGVLLVPFKRVIFFMQAGGWK